MKIQKFTGIFYHSSTTSVIMPNVAAGQAGQKSHKKLGLLTKKQV